MKTFYLITLLFLCNILTAQIVNIPDANFKNALVNENVADTDGNGTLEDADTNNDGEIQLSEAQAVTVLQVLSYDISSLEGIQSFTNLEELLCQSNNLSEIDVSQNVLLTQLWVSNNQLTALDVTSNPELVWLVNQMNLVSSLDLSQNLNLVHLRTSFNELSEIDVSSNLNLQFLWCSSNNLSSIDVTANSEIINLSVGNNQLNYLNIQNGNNANMTRMWAQNNPALSCILVDDVTAMYPTCDQGSNQGWCKDEATQYVEDLSGCELGINDYTKTEIKVFPNPSNGLINVLTNEPISWIYFYSIDGRYQGKFTKTEIDISHLQNGIYFIEVLLENGKKAIQKIIKQ